ncbi:hypothetical protein [Roseibium sp. M-1]
MNFRRLFLFMALIWIAATLSKFANQNYEAIKTDYSLAAPILLLLTGLALLVTGVLTLFRSFRKS